MFFFSSAGKYFELHFTGTTPQNQRLHYLNTNNQQAFVLGIWYAASWRLDVSAGETYVTPKNGELNAKGQVINEAK